MVKQSVLAYLTYPLSNGSFKGNKIEAERLAVQIQQEHPEIYIIIPYFSTQYCDRVENYRSIEMDIKIIEKCDLVILGKEPDYAESAGCVWEYMLSKVIGKKVVTSDYLLGYTKKPLGWAKRMPIFNF